MKKLISGHLAVFGFCAVFFILALVVNTATQIGRRGDVKTSIGKVKTFDGVSDIPYTGALLTRNNKGVFSTISTSGLTPGTVITLWWVIFNNPEECLVKGCSPPDLNNPVVNASLQYGGGTIVGAGGRVDFSGYLTLGENSGFHYLPQFPNMPNPAPGVVDSEKAAIHLVIRSHGPASTDPVVLNEQLTTFGGGCSANPNPCANIQAAVFVQ